MTAVAEHAQQEPARRTHEVIKRLQSLVLYTRASLSYEPVSSMVPSGEKDRARTWCSAACSTCSTAWVLQGDGIACSVARPFAWHYTLLSVSSLDIHYTPAGAHGHRHHAAAAGDVPAGRVHFLLPQRCPLLVSRCFTTSAPHVAVCARGEAWPSAQYRRSGMRPPRFVFFSRL